MELLRPHVRLRLHVVGRLQVPAVVALAGHALVAHQMLVVVRVGRQIAAGIVVVVLLSERRHASVVIAVVIVVVVVVVTVTVEGVGGLGARWVGAAAAGGVRRGVVG